LFRKRRGTAALLVLLFVLTSLFGSSASTFAEDVNKTQLTAAISTADFKLSTTLVGKAPGNVLQTTHDTFAAAIAAAVVTRDNVTATQTEVDAAVTTLADASTAFDNAVLPNKGNLIAAVDNAVALLNTTIIGTLPGNVSEVNYNAFASAITTASAVRDNISATQAEVNTALVDLATATEIFEDAIVPNRVPLATEITNATVLLDSITIGTEAGNVSGTAHNAFATAIAAAGNVRDNPSATPSDVIAAIDELAAATTAFQNAIIPNKEALAAAIGEANTLLNNTPVGTARGNVSNEDHDTFLAAIITAIAVNNNAAATKNEVNAAIASLATAAAAFENAVITTIEITLNPGKITANYPLNFEFSLPGISLINEAFAKITGTNIELPSVPAAVYGADTYQVSFPPLPEPGEYDLSIFDGPPVAAVPPVAIGHFEVVPSIPWLNIMPYKIVNGYQKKHVWINQAVPEQLWNNNDTLKVNIYHIQFDNANPLSPPVKTFITAVDPGYIDSWGLNFVLPTGLGPNNYQAEVVRDSTVIAYAGFQIFIPDFEFIKWFRYSEQIKIFESDGPDVWSPFDTLEVKIYKTPSTEGPRELAATILSGAMSITDNMISFAAPENLLPGDCSGPDSGIYQFEIIRNGSIITIGEFGVDWALISAAPERIEIGYKTPVPIILNTNGLSGIWSADNVPVMKLFRYGSESLQDTGIVLTPQSINNTTLTVSLPTNLPMGGYEIQFNKNNSIIAWTHFEIGPTEFAIITKELPPAFVGQFYDFDLQATGGWGGTDWHNDYGLPMGLSLDNNGHIWGYPQQVGEWHFTAYAYDSHGNSVSKQFTLRVNNNLSQLAAGKVKGLPGSSVMVPISGLNLKGVRGIQFAMSYDPTVADVEKDEFGEVIIESDIAGVTWGANVVANAGMNTLYVSMASNTVLPSEANLCRIKFQVTGQAEQLTPLIMEPIDEVFLSDGENDVLAEAEDGFLKVAKYGDINGNGSVDVGDAVLMLRHDAGYINLSPEELNLANVDGSRDTYGNPTVDYGDAILTLKYIVKLIPSLPYQP